jgi:CRISPR-associated protein (TIGR03986 family)
MATGTINRIIKNFGFIKQDEGGDDVHFYIKWVKGVALSQVVEGLRVEYEARETPKGLQTKWIRALEATAPEHQFQSKVDEDKENYRFLNPYNFVRLLGEPQKKAIEQPNETQLLWRCPPPPHDRYVGLTGRITCEVTAKTPLFISDSHAVQEGNDKHKSYRFFQYNGQSALPASSLRGMIRSVFESVTNSCLTVFTNKTLSQHFDSKKAPWLVPARVEKNGEDWQLRLLIGTTNLQIYEANTEPQGIQYAAWLHRYWPMQPSGTLTKTKGVNQKTRLFQARRRSGTEVDIGDLKHGQECFALLEETEHPHPKVVFWDVIAVDTDRKILEHKMRHQRGQKQRIEKGWLCLNNQNIEAKHSERFFFRSISNRVGPELIELPNPVREAYEALIKDYQERHQNKVQDRRANNQSLNHPISKKKGEREAGLSRFIYNLEEQKLKGGELVYAFLDDNSTVDNPVVKFIVPVSVPRVGYERSVGDLLPDDLHACQRYNSLCPACRTFGWVWKRKAKDEEQPQITAYAGRVRFSHGQLKESKGELPETTLAILSTPKPTTTLFYLLKDGNPDSNVNYNSDKAQLRGRKVYRHHGKQLRTDEYTRDPNRDQNRTIRGALDKGAKFTFIIDFENLAEVGFGALLWALEFEGDGTMFHRLGYAKPLGLGSVEIKVNKLEVLQPGERYKQLESWDDGWQPISIEQMAKWKEAFKNTMEDLYNRPFTDLENIRDLQVLLSEPEESIPIHYPRSEPSPSDDEENFKWFVEAKKQKEILLPLPSGDGKEALPLLGQKKGRRK